MKYEIQSGDSLASLAFKFYGNSLEYTRILEANPFLEWWGELTLPMELTIPEIKRKEFSKKLWKDEKKRKERLEEYPGTEELEVSNGDFLETVIGTETERNIEIPRRFI